MSDRQHGARRLVILRDNVADADLIPRIEFSPSHAPDRLRFSPRVAFVS
jgi:hypothetical protein